MRERSHLDGEGTPDGAPRALYVVLIGLLVAGSAAAHAAVRLKPPSYAGPLLIADHVFDVVASLVLLLICGAVGRLALHRLRLRFDRPPEQLVFSTALGAAIVSTLILGLGLIGALQRPTLILLFLACALLARRELLAVPRSAIESVRFVTSRAGHPAYAVACLAIVAAVTVVMLLHAVAPPTDWDSLMYHLEVPRQFLEEGRIFLLEDNIHVAFVGLVHMLYLPLLALQSPAGPAVLSAAFALLLGFAVFSLAERFFDGVTASLSLITLWAATSILLVAITPRVDVTVAFYVFLAQYALLLALSRPRAPFYLAALLLGFAVAVKLIALVYAVALSPLVFWTARTETRSFNRTLSQLGLFGLVALAAVAPWLGKNWLLLDAPFYPYLSERMLEPWLAALYGNASVPEAVNREVFAAISNARLPFSIVDLFLAPGRLTVEQEGVHYHMNFFILLAPLAILFVRNRTLRWLFAPTIIYLLLIVLPFGKTNLRYLIPALPPLTVVSAHVAARVAQRYLSAGAARLLLVSLAVLALYPSGKAMHSWLRRSDVLGHFAGVTSEQSYLQGGFFFYSQMTQAVNQMVPEQGKVLLLFEARAYYFEPDVIQDNLLTNWALLAPYATQRDDCLNSSGISHFLVSDAAVRYYARRGTDPRLLALDDLRAFAGRCLSLVHRGRGFTILRVDPSGAGERSGQSDRTGAPASREGS